MVFFYFHQLIQDITGDFNLGTIVSLMVGLTALGAAIFKGIKWYSGQNDERARIIKSALEEQAKTVKEQSEIKAREIKETAEQNARQIKDAAEQNARQIQVALDDRARDLKEVLAERAEKLKEALEAKDREFKDLYFKETAELKSKITTIDTVLKNMFAELKNRADLTNGNVASIRNDIADVQDDISDIYQILEPQRATDNRGKTARDKDVRARERRDQIETDRKSQRHGMERE